MNDIAISVIIPFYSQKEWLIDAVESVFAQSFTNYEIIIINDGSKEDISGFLKEYGDRIIYRYKENGGPASARNLGIELAKGKYVAFLDSDDIWYESKLKKQFELMETSNAIWSHTSYSIFKNGQSNILFKKINLSYFKGNVFPWCLVSSPIATPCIMIRKQFLTDYPSIRFCESMRYGQDWYLWINIAIKEPLIVITEALTKVRIRGSNAALRARVQLKARAQIWNYIIRKNDLLLKTHKGYIFLKISFRMCDLGNQFIELFENHRVIRSRMLELVSKLLYVLPYSIFTFINIFYFKRKNYNEINS